MKCSPCPYTDRDRPSNSVYPVGLQQSSERDTGELAALIGVEDLRNAVAFQRLRQRRQAELGVHRVGQPPRQHPPAGPVHDRHQVQEPALHRDVGDVRAPHLIRSLNRKPPQQIGIHPVLRVGDAGARLAVDRFQPQQPHQPPHPVPTNRHPLARQMAHHLTAAVERVLQVQLVDTAHQLQCRRALPERSVVQRRAAHTEQSALPAHTQTLVLAFDHRQSLGPTQRPSPRDKKSRSTVNSPILACRS